MTCRRDRERKGTDEWSRFFETGLGLRPFPAQGQWKHAREAFFALTHGEGPAAGHSRAALRPGSIVRNVHLFFTVS